MLLPDGEAAQRDGEAGNGGNGRLRVVCRDQHAQGADRQQRGSECGTATIEPVGRARDHHEVEPAEKSRGQARCVMPGQHDAKDLAA
jgi:hypothetical protein